MSSISGIGSYASSYTSASSTSGAHRSHRPDPGKMADELFSQLDSTGKGYVEKSDFESAFAQLSGSSSSASSNSASVDEVFSQLDGDGDGKVTKDEMSTSIKKLADELDSQFNQMRMSGQVGGKGGMPPPPPPADDAGFTKDEMTSQLSEIGSSDSQQASLISNIVNNFEAADSDGDGDGKVSFLEAMAYDQKNSTTSTSDRTNSAASTSASSSTNSSNNDLAIMKRIMDLMHAYQDSSSSSVTSLLSTLSTSA